MDQDYNKKKFIWEYQGSKGISEALLYIIIERGGWSDGCSSHFHNGHHELSGNNMVIFDFAFLSVFKVYAHSCFIC